MPVLSIVVPIYNVAPFLEACLASIERQTLADLEVILVDDGSTDASGDIARSWASARPARYRFLHQDNQGLSAARNSGMAVASGDYLLLLDSDDLLADDGLLPLLEQARQQQLDVAVGNFCHLYQSGELGRNRALHCGGPVRGADWLAAALKRRKYQPAVWYRLYRRAFLQQHGLQFVPGLINEDQLFSAQVMLLAQRVAAFDLPFYHYRHRPGSISNERSAERALVRLTSDLYSAREILGWARRHGDPRLTRLLMDQALRPVASAFATALLALPLDAPTLQPLLADADALQFYRYVRIRRWSQLIDFLCLRAGFRHFLRWRQRRRQ